MTPTPRNGSYLGMVIVNSDFPDGTWLEGEEFAYPKGKYTRRAYANCEDGKRRVVACSIPDTYFTIPAVAKIDGKIVCGCLSSGEGEGLKFIADK